MSGNLPLIQIPDDNNNNSNSGSTSNGEVNYVGGAKFLVGGVTKNVQAQPPKRVDYGIWTRDIAQSHHFTVFVQGLPGYVVPNAPYPKFLSVKSINLNYTSYENMTIPIQIFGDFPILNRKRVATISLTCFDTDDNALEHSLRIWESQCFPQNKFVAYMEDIAREFEYRGYDVKGKQTLKARYFVIPSGSVAVGRDYSANDAKLVNFSLVVVGDGASSASGDSSYNSNNADDFKWTKNSRSLYVTGQNNWHGQ